MSRVRIWTAPEPAIGEIVADELRAAGLPITVMPNGTELYPSGPLTDLWLEDEALLKDPAVQKTIADALADRPLSEEDAEAVDAMPYVEPPAAESRYAKPSPSAFWANVAILVFVLLVAWLVLSAVGVLGR